MPNKFNAARWQRIPKMKLTASPSSGVALHLRSIERLRLPKRLTLQRLRK
jgi:hypothetical protein